MATLFLVRHGQASFGADDYDQLSELGQRQSQRLGHYFAAKSIVFDAVYTGTLRRHAQTLDGLCDGLQTQLSATACAGLNEYDSAAVIAGVHPDALERPTTPELYRHHFRLLRQGLTQWMLGRITPVGLPSWPDFAQGVVDVLSQIQQSDAQNVLLVSSGGPIACAIGHVLATPAAATLELNMRLRNTAVSELTFTPKRYALNTYNSVAHLDSPGLSDWMTHA
ncbi:MAG: histidine phosphatase family protein [Rhodoferax sp.]|nr:histidine phosphatase family protein [Rhodoferax sp.]